MKSYYFRNIIIISSIKMMGPGRIWELAKGGNFQLPQTHVRLGPPERPAGHWRGVDAGTGSHGALEAGCQCG